MPQVVSTERGELYKKTGQRVSEKRLLEIRQVIRELTRTDMIAHRPYTAGAMCVMIVETVKRSLPARSLNRTSGAVVKEKSGGGYWRRISLCRGRKRWREKKGLKELGEGYIKTLEHL